MCNIRTGIETVNPCISKDSYQSFRADIKIATAISFSFILLLNLNISKFQSSKLWKHCK